MRTAPWLLIVLSILFNGAAQKQIYIARYLTDFPGPQVYKDATSGTLVYVETDGRHVAAFVLASRGGDVFKSPQVCSGTHPVGKDESSRPVDNDDTADGKLLWNRDPYKDAHLEFYRTEKPQIVYIGPTLKSQLRKGEKLERFVRITFNSSKFGVMRISDGEFYFGGQD